MKSKSKTLLLIGLLSYFELIFFIFVLVLFNLDIIKPYIEQAYHLIQQQSELMNLTLAEFTSKIKTMIYILLFANLIRSGLVFQMVKKPTFKKLNIVLIVQFVFLVSNVLIGFLPSVIYQFIILLFTYIYKLYFQKNNKGDVL